MASSPGYNPNKIESLGRLREHHPLAELRARARRRRCYNRATQGLYAPGSTFKTVTAAAALDSGKYTPDSQFYDPGYCTEYGVQVHNALDQNGPEQFGNVDLNQAFIHSINAVFCDLGIKLGAKTVLDKAKRLRLLLEAADRAAAERGGGERPLRLRACTAYRQRPTCSIRADWRSARSKLLVTPLQMALVAAGVANKGTIMQPHLVNRVTAPERRHGRQGPSAGLEARDEAVDGRRDQRDDAGRRPVRHGPGRPDPRGQGRRQDRNRRDRRAERLHRLVHLLRSRRRPPGRGRRRRRAPVERLRRRDRRPDRQSS